MAATNAKFITIRLSEKIGYIKGFSWSPDHGEILVIGEEGLIVLTTTGDIIEIVSFPFDAKIIAQQRTLEGWQILSQANNQLRISTVSNNDSAGVLLEDVAQELRTASWSPCGKYIAVGSVGTYISVWETDTGILHWRKSIKWDTDEFLTPPTLSVVGWSDDGNTIVTSAEYMISVVIFVWDASNGDVLTAVD
jgi:WD40 repeat protein